MTPAGGASARAINGPDGGDKAATASRSVVPASEP